MSFQLDQEKGKEVKIEMPPLAAETPEVVENQGEMGQDLVENPVFPAEAALDEAMEPLQATQPAIQQEEGWQAKNFKRLRLEAEQVKAERDDMARRLAAYEASQQKSRYQQEPIDEEFNINSDDIVEGKHLQQYAKKMKQLEAQIYQQQQQSSAALAEAQLRSQYPDFDQVVNENTLEHFKYAFPQVANSLNSSSDLYSKAVIAYTMIKNSGIAPKGDDYVAQKAQAQRNANKPKPLASVNPQQGDSPLSKANAFANGLTDELKAQLRREMEQARANH